MGYPFENLSRFLQQQVEPGSRWKMQTKQDLLIGKVILGRAIVE